ncbi:Isopenicillin N synthase [Artemisia annua]|nr:Isopenicillin N synthase [Artemisia annua]
MESGDCDENKAFSIGEPPQENGLSHVPRSYEISSSNRPSLNPEIANVAVVDLVGLNDPDQRPMVVKNIGSACRESGFFQIINHGISQKVLDEALGTAFAFFDLPTTEKEKYMSNDVHKPVRYGTSIKDEVDKIQYRRGFLKHYAHPLNEWIQEWPDKPHDYRDKMGSYVMKARRLSIEIMGAITESLGIGRKYLENKMEDGMQVMAVNCYPKCPEPHLALGVPPHSDHTCITIVLQSSCGLEIIDAADGTWRLVPELQGALEVHVGDHVEVLSNGLYKSMVHRVTLNNERTRISIVSLHSMGLDEKMATAQELVSDENPKKYKESSFRDFLNFLTRNEGKSYIESLKM